MQNSFECVDDHMSEKCTFECKIVNDQRIAPALSDFFSHPGDWHETQCYLFAVVNNFYFKSIIFVVVFLKIKDKKCIEQIDVNILKVKLSISITYSTAMTRGCG